jgi:aconitate hydratase
VAADPQAYRRLYANLGQANPLWAQIEPQAQGAVYGWPQSTYIARPPFLDAFAPAPGLPGAIRNARALAVLGDSVTTDHISPAGNIAEGSPAGRWLKARGVAKSDFNSYGARRGHHEIMVRGTFANVRLRNLMLPPNASGEREEGGWTLFQPGGERMAIFDAAERYRAAGVPLIVFGGEEYGTGSSRDWAAKGTALLGVRAVVACSFERIHRANLVGMGVLPLQLPAGVTAGSLRIDGSESFDLDFDPQRLAAGQDVGLVIRRTDGRIEHQSLRLRIDTPVEVDYFRHGGILPYVLRQILQAKAG